MTGFATVDETLSRLTVAVRGGGGGVGLARPGPCMGWWCIVSLGRSCPGSGFCGARPLRFLGSQLSCCGS